MAYEDASPVFLLNRPASGGGKAAVVAFLIVVLFAGLGALGGLVVVWTAKPPANIAPPVDEAFYGMKIWGTASLPPHFAASEDLVAMQKYSISFLWDVYPLLEQVPQAENLALKWPPARGSRYRLAAYPFVQTGKDVLPVAVAKSILRMVNKYKDEATPPAWYVSVYDDSDWTRKNIFLPAPDKEPSTHLSCRSSAIFQPFKWIEVTRTCYPVKKDSYPLCDDGGQWFYHAPGSGVWYNLGNTLVRYNKIDAAVYCMALAGLQYATGGDLTKVRTVMGEDFPPILLSLPQQQRSQYKITYASLLQVTGVSLDDYPSYGSDATGPTPTWQAYWSVAKAHFAKRVTSYLGEKSFVRALMKLIKDSKDSGSADLKLQGFLPFQAFSTPPGTPRTGFLTLLAVLGGVLGLLVAILFLFLKGQLVAPLVLLLAAGAGLWFGWETGLEAFVNSQGVYMLAKGLDLKQATVSEVIDFCVEPARDSPSPPEKQQFFSGLPSSWIADLIIEVLASMLGFDTVVMHSQPNKSGTYLVEIVDVTKIPMAFGNSPGGDPQWWKGGTCGNESAATPLTNFGCTDCPYSQAHTAGSRGGLCFVDTPVRPTPPPPPRGRSARLQDTQNSNYYSMKWITEEGVVAAEDPYTTQGQYPLKSQDMSNWLFKFGAQSCSCREVSSAMCLGCEGFISDHLCNWSTPASSLSPGQK
jgi:hypothetical protein